jgi:hypothetical protein
MKFDDDQLYACGEEGGHVAGMVQRSSEDGADTITWVMPEGRQRAYEIAEVIEDSDERFEFRTTQGVRFELVRLTADHYNARIRRRGQPKYKTDEEMLEAYRQSLNG